MLLLGEIWVGYACENALKRAELIHDALLSL